MKKILQLLKPYWKKLSVSLFLKVVGTICDLLLPWLIAYMIDEEIPRLQLQSNQSLNTLYGLGFLMVLIALLGFRLNVFANRQAEYIAAYATETLRNEVFEKIQTLSSKQVDGLTRPSLISRMTTDTYNLYSAMASIQRIGIRAPVLLFGGIIVAFSLDPILTLVMLATLPFVVLVTTYSTKRSLPLYKNTQKYTDYLILKIRSFIQGVRVVRALSMKEYEKDSFKKVNERVIEAELEAHRVVSKVGPLMSIIMNLGLVIVLVMGAYRIFGGTTNKGQIMALVTYFTIILNAMMSITRVFILLSRANASAQRIDEIMELEEDIVSGELKEIEKVEPLLEFHHVNFSYNGKVNNISDATFSIKTGETLGIIGGTGSGKTTLIQLIMRFYDTQSGEIIYRGKHIESYDLKTLRNDMAAVLQQDLIFSGTILDNLTLGKNYDMKDIEEAIRIASADFIYEKPEGLDYKVHAKGTNLSGGQKQRILIARALLKNPSVLILDDASSALDYETDMKIRQALRSYNNMTKIIVAQRISSIKDADLILLIDEGKIIAKGTHEHLIETNEQYRTIYEHQLGGEVL